MTKLDPGLFMQGLFHPPGAWRDSEIQLDGALDIAHSILVAQMVGQGLFDDVFQARQSALKFNVSVRIANRFWEA